MSQQNETPISLEKYLEAYGTLTYTFKGVSMLPMLREKHGDLPEIVKKVGRAKKYDVALYRSNIPGKYILHRIVKVLPQGYVFLGDNCVSYEHVREEDVIGVLVRFRRGKGGCFANRCISVESRGYKLYSRVWCAIFPLRRIYKKLRRFAGRCWHKGLRILGVERRK